MLLATPQTLIFAIYVTESTSLSFSETSNFDQNLGYIGGAIWAQSYSILTFSGASNFSKNYAVLGGATCAEVGTIIFTNNGHDTHNLNPPGDNLGGGVWIDYST